MTKDEALALDLALEALENNRRTHYYCEDTWYSCPKHEDGCANEAEGDECNCGADKANQEIDNAITAIKQARALDKKAENARELGLDYEPAEVLGHNGWGFPIKAAAPVQEDWGPGPHECHSLTAAPVQEPLEYWNAVEGWVKIDEVRQHFNSVGCGTIYKNAGEDRVPLYTVAQRKWVGLTQQDIDIAFDDTQEGGGFDEFARAIEQRLKEKNT